MTQGTEGRTNSSSDLLLDALPLAVISFRADGRCVAANNAAAELVGLSRELLLSRDFSSLGILVDADVRECGSRVQATGKPFHREVRFINAVGRELWVECWFTAVVLDGGNGILATLNDVTSRRRAESELREAKDYAENLVGTANAMVISLDLKGDILQVNQAVEDVTGYSRGELMGRSWDMVLPRDRYPDVWEAFGLLPAAEVPRRHENPIVTKSGEERFIMWQNRPLTRDGAVIGILSYGIDTTERKRAEEALGRSEAKYRLLYQGMIDGFARVDMSGRIIEFNQAFKEMLGYTDDELLSMDYQDVTPDMWHAAESRILDRQVMVRGYSDLYEKEYRRKDGTVFPVELRTELWRDETGLPVGMWAIIRDISDRRRTEETLRLHEHRFQEMFEHMSSGVAVYAGVDEGQDFVVSAFNPAAERATRVRKDEVVGRRASEVFPGMGGFGLLDAFRRVWRTGIPERFQAERYRDGRISLWVQNYIFRLTSGEIVAIFDDVSQQKKAARKLQKRTEELSTTVKRLRETQFATIQTLGSVTEYRDPYTAGHQQRVAALASGIAEEMGLPAEQVEGLRVAGLVHDIGKFAVPVEILVFPGPLGAAERSLINMHPQAGYEMLGNISFPWPVADIILQHHERQDGSGYPRGLSGDEIMLEARIIGVADTVEAMSSHRPYRAALGIEIALDHIDASRDIFDSTVVDACLRLIHDKGFVFSDQNAGLRRQRVVPIKVARSASQVRRATTSRTSTRM